MPAALWPLTNAVLVALGAALVLRGYLLIRRGERARHRRAMLAGTAVAALFFASYLLRIAVQGNVGYHGDPAWRTAYLVLLTSHVSLAALQAPLTLFTLWRAGQADWPGHRRLGRITFPIWMYVAVTGIAVYIFLHHI